MTENQAASTSKGLLWTGRVLSAIPVLLMTMGVVMVATRNPKVTEGFTHFGYSESALVPIVIAEFCCVLLYAIPRTSVLGAILMTGYLGGATATHVRLGEPLFVVPVLLGVVVWLGLYLRDNRLRALVPFRS